MCYNNTFGIRVNFFHNAFNQTFTPETLNVEISVSANFTSAPTYRAQLASATNVSGVVIKFPFEASSTHIANKCKAEADKMPLEHVTEKFCPYI